MHSKVHTSHLSSVPLSCRSSDDLDVGQMIVATFRESVFGSSSSNKIRALDRFDTPSEEGDDDEIVEVGPPSGKYIGWAYVGSHNFTPSAWGTLSGSSFNPVLNASLLSFSLCYMLMSSGFIPDYEL